MSGRVTHFRSPNVAATGRVCVCVYELLLAGLEAIKCPSTCHAQVIEVGRHHVVPSLVEHDLRIASIEAAQRIGVVGCQCTLEKGWQCAQEICEDVDELHVVEATWAAILTVGHCVLYAHS